MRVLCLSTESGDSLRIHLPKTASTLSPVCTRLTHESICASLGYAEQKNSASAGIIHDWQMHFFVARQSLRDYVLKGKEEALGNYYYEVSCVRFGTGDGASPPKVPLSTFFFFFFFFLGGGGVLCVCVFVYVCELAGKGFL